MTRLKTERHSALCVMMIPSLALSKSGYAGYGGSADSQPALAGSPCSFRRGPVIWMNGSEPDIGMPGTEEADGFHNSGGDIRLRQGSSLSYDNCRVVVCQPDSKKGAAGAFKSFLKLCFRSPDFQERLADMIGTGLFKVVSSKSRFSKGVFIFVERCCYIAFRTAQNPG